jgi:hypothetical protein
MMKLKLHQCDGATGARAQVEARVGALDRKLDRVLALLAGSADPAAGAPAVAPAVASAAPPRVAMRPQEDAAAAGAAGVGAVLGYAEYRPSAA